MTQQNQEIINNLLEQQKTSTYAKQLALDKDEAQMSVTRVVTAKYKVYVIFLLILGVILGTQYLPKAWDTYTKIQGTVDFKMQERSSLKMELDQLAKDQKQLLSIQKNKDLIVHCVNNRQGCASLPQDVSKNLDAVISYLQLGGLSSSKMIVDEKKILKNLDQYLIRNNPEERASTSNGAIEQIEIGEPEQVDGVDHGADAAKLFKLPVTLKVLFSNKDDLISFVDNIEKFIIPQEEDRILYEINEVAYDMMQYDQAQTTELQLTAYYFN